jgi:hypothetical protein
MSDTKTTSGFSGMKRTIMDRIATKSNLHDQLKMKKFKPESTKSALVSFKHDEHRSKSTINPSITNRKFLQNTPSIKDMDIRKLIGKYPV